MSFFGSSAARSSSFAAISLALSSRTSDPSQMMRSFSSRSKTPGLGVASAMCRSVSVVAFTRIYPVQHTGSGLFALGGGRELRGVCRDRHAVARQGGGGRGRRERREGLGCRAAGVARIDERERAERHHRVAELTRIGLDRVQELHGPERTPEVPNGGANLEV